MQWGAILSGFISGSVATVILPRLLGDWWLERQRASYNRELERFKDQLLGKQKQIQAVIDNSVFVTRTHFDTEFTAMKKIFSRLSKVKMMLSTFSIRSMGKSPTVDEAIENRREALADASYALRESLDELLPFIPVQLSIVATHCYDAAMDQLHHVRQALQNGTPYIDTVSENGARNYAMFLNNYNKASDMIRDRIAELTVLPPY